MSEFMDKDDKIEEMSERLVLCTSDLVDTIVNLFTLNSTPEQQPEQNGTLEVPTGAISLHVCADYLSNKFAQTFTTDELKELCESRNLPHTIVQGKGISCHAVKVAAWIKKNIIEECEGKPLELETVYLGKDPPTFGVPLSLCNISGLRVIQVTKFPPCIYFLVRKKEVVYVGQSISLMSRIQGHGDKDFDSVFYVAVLESRIVETEDAFIRAMQPIYNKTHRDEIPTDRDKQILLEFA